MLLRGVSSLVCVGAGVLKGHGIECHSKSVFT